MYEFAYQRPGSLIEASRLLESIPGAKILAGGQSLLAMMKHRLARASTLVDLRGIQELSSVSSTKDQLDVGAMVRHATVAASEHVQGTIPALAKLAAGIGDRMVRNMGTLGGSVANADPAADYPAALLGLDATVITSTRTIPADRFFVGMFDTALEQGEIITSVRFRIPKRAAYVKFKNAASRFAIVGVFVADFESDVRVAVTGAGPCVFRSSPMEEALRSKFAPSSLSNIKIDEQGLNGDIHASAAYRAHLIHVIARRAVEAAAAGV